MNPGEAELEGLDHEASLSPIFGRIRLRTLILLRWLGVAGQTVTVLGVHFGLGFELPLAACLGVIAASALVNLWLSFALTMQRFAKDWEAAAQLGYDLLQLMALLALTGGLTNPFSIIMIAPVVIGVACLPARWWAALAGFAILGSLAQARWHLPLPWTGTPVPVLPATYQIGMWLALAITIGFTAVYAWRVSHEARRMSTALTATQIVLAREQRLSALGALSAAAAHELGTPLATIQLTAKELLRFAESEAVKEDAELLVSQAERCRDILRRLSRTQQAEDKMHDRLTLGQAMEEAAAPLNNLGAQIGIHLNALDGEREPPLLQRRAEMLYAIGNFVENAVDYARSRVDITGRWGPDLITVEIEDDGPGFPPDVLAKLGEPYISSRRGGHRAGGGLGLGVFIAINLTERLGGRVDFSNAAGRGGARVTLTWPREALAAHEEDPPAL